VALLEDDDPLRLGMLPDLGAALAAAGDLERAGVAFAEATKRAETAGDDRLRAHAVVQRWLSLGVGDITEMRREAERALVVFEAAGDERGMSRALRALGDVDYRAGRIGARDRAMERALVHARKAGDAREQSEIYGALSVDLNQGSTPAIDGIRRCEQVLAEEGGNRTIAAYMFHALAHMRAMRGEFEEALSLAERFREILRDNGAMSTFWFETTGDIVPNHYLSEDVPEEVAGRAIRVRNLQMYPVECVVRGYLSGSGWKEYRESGAVCGLDLPEGLVESSK
jgi:tetratricopeptide (TPR) repeat protein